MRRLLWLLVPVVLVSGCDLYWNQGDDDCEYYATSGAEGDIAPAPGVRNPNTGELPGRSTEVVSALQTIHHSKEYPSRIVLPGKKTRRVR